MKKSPKGRPARKGLRHPRAPIPPAEARTQERPCPPQRPQGRRARAAVVLAAILLPQAVLFGPSILGRKILLPLDLLALDRVYLPRAPEYASVVTHDPVLSDQVFAFEPARRYAASEVRAGRLPLWTPNYFGGAPFAAWPKYSPFHLIHYAFPSPFTLVWMHLAKSLVAGLGAYLYFRRILRVAFWPAAIGSGCYPLTGFFMLWQGYLSTLVTPWFPWVLIATDRAVRQPRGWGGPALAVVSGLVVISGQVDIAAQVLLASGIYALWCLIDEHAQRPWSGRMLGSAVAPIGAWVLGLALSAPHLLPLVEYAQTGSRMIRRGAGSEERPPIGLLALPQTVLPKIYGSTERGPGLIPGGNLQESAAGAYTGLLATLFLAPLAWCSAPHRSINRLWMVLAFAALAWPLDVPGVVALLRLPPLNMLSHNRFVFVASFAVLAMAVVALDLLWRGDPPWRGWFLGPAALVAGLGIFCLHRALHLPEPIATELTRAVQEGRAQWWAADLPAVREIQRSFVRYALQGASISALAVAGWLGVRWRLHGWTFFAPLVGGLVAAELVWFARDLNPQTDPSLYYPRLPVLGRLAEAPPGRVLGVNCLPANLLESHGLRDIRGYDGVDPRSLLEVLELARLKAADSHPYASTQWYVPALPLTPSGEIKVPPILSMLNVRYFVFRGAPPAGVVPLFREGDYWAVENPGALPRVYVPRTVETVRDERGRLALLAMRDFDPRQVAYLESPVTLPGEAQGRAAVVDEIPGRVTVSTDMQTPGLVVLADRWDRGWRAELDGRPVEVLRVNHVLRGVVAPAGRNALVFRYEPASFLRGLWLMALALGGLAAWAGLRGRTPATVNAPPQAPHV